MVELQKEKGPDLTFICWELECREKNLDWGYPCRGYPSADKLIPAFKAIGVNVQTIEFNQYASVKLEPDMDKPFPYRILGSSIKSENVVLEWDGITSRRDYQSIFDWKKKLYVIPHHEGRIAGYNATPEEERALRAKITHESTKVIFELQTLRDLWRDFECDKFELFYPPTRTGMKFAKKDAKNTLGIKTEHSIIAWGEYTSGKRYGDMLPWIQEWKDTSLLFCGSGERTEKAKLKKKAEELQISDRVFFSDHAISDEESDLWFSASDLCTCPRTFFGTATPIYILGQGKICILPAEAPVTSVGCDKGFWKGYDELEKISGVVTSNDLKRTTRKLLDDEGKRNQLEAKSIKYAEDNSFENYAKKLMKLIK